VPRLFCEAFQHCSHSSAALALMARLGVLKRDLHVTVGSSQTRSRARVKAGKRLRPKLCRSAIQRHARERCRIVYGCELEANSTEADDLAHDIGRVRLCDRTVNDVESGCLGEALENAPLDFLGAALVMVLRADHRGVCRLEGRLCQAGASTLARGRGQ
jgi:hypothetical protein